MPMIVDNSLNTSENDEMTLTEFQQILMEVRDQPSWRAEADKDMDYRDGNQLDTDILQRMSEIGMPAAVMPLIGLSVESALGAQTQRRTDWRVGADSDGDPEGEQVAEAFNYKLNQAERLSRADRACSDAYEQQYCVGVGWVEVTKDQNPFAYPYRCLSVHRNEMFWDWDGYLKSPMGDNARYCGRKRWHNKDILKLKFPEHAELIEQVAGGWSSINLEGGFVDGGHDTGLYNSMEQERGWTIEEAQWRNTFRKMVMLFEIWYRRWHNAVVLKTSDGRIVEFNSKNPRHLMAIAMGGQVERAVISKVRRAWFIGPHKLADEPSPYIHNYFGYVPFWGWREDRTGVPYGRIRAMRYMQDNINATLSKIRWGLSSVVVTRTDGAYKGKSSQLRNQVARVDADIVLDREHMALPGATFTLERNFQLTEQQYKMYLESVSALQQLSGIGNSFQGQESPSVHSASQFHGMVEQSKQGLANLDDNFDESRMQVGELLLAMIIQDSMGKPETVRITGGALRDDKEIPINQPYTDDVTGIELLSNDVSRIMLKVTLDDVPQTKSYRQQQLMAFSEAFKSTTPDFQKVMMPHMINLMDIPNKDEIIKTMRDLEQQVPPDIKMAMDELKLKTDKNDAEIELLKAQRVKVGTESQFAAMQAGQVVAAMPEVAPVADVVMKNAGYQPPNPAGTDPNYPIPAVPQAVPQPEQRQNTSPQMPPVPRSPQTGIETPRPTDNFVTEKSNEQ